VLGFLFGFKSKNFQQFKASAHYKHGMMDKFHEWQCFSIVTKSRTLDFAAYDEDHVTTWILGLQELLDNPFMQWTRGGLLGRRGWMKVGSIASSSGMSQSKMLLKHIKITMNKQQSEHSRKGRSVFTAGDDTKLDNGDANERRSRGSLLSASRSSARDMQDSKTADNDPEVKHSGTSPNGGSTNGTTVDAHIDSVRDQLAKAAAVSMSDVRHHPHNAVDDAAAGIAATVTAVQSDTKRAERIKHIHVESEAVRDPSVAAAMKLVEDQQLTDNKDVTTLVETLVTQQQKERTRSGSCIMSDKEAERRHMLKVLEGINLDQPLLADESDTKASNGTEATIDVRNDNGEDPIRHSDADDIVDSSGMESSTSARPSSRGRRRSANVDFSKAKAQLSITDADNDDANSDPTNDENKQNGNASAAGNDDDNHDHDADEDAKMIGSVQIPTQAFERAGEFLYMPDDEYAQLSDDLLHLNIFLQELSHIRIDAPHQLTAVQAMQATSKCFMELRQKASTFLQPNTTALTEIQNILRLLRLHS
jgi:hypothetical protein